MLGARESLDDEHRRAAVPAHERRWPGPLCGVGVAVGRRCQRRDVQERARRSDILLAGGVGEQAIVAEAVKAFGL